MKSEIIKNLFSVQMHSKLFYLPVFVFLVFFTQSGYSQSSDVNFPTPIISNEITGTIPARAVGDSRLTRYYYQFNGNQGDIFINVKTNNLDGDIEIFTIRQLDSLTKITIYSDSSQDETGRVIYLRKPEKLILRIEARSPNDDPATFNIKFAGSFAPLPLTSENLRMTEPKVKGDNQGKVKVNSVGTIIEAAKTEQVAETEKIETNENPVETEKIEKTEVQTVNPFEKSDNKTDETANAEMPQTFDPTKKTESIFKDLKVENKERKEIVNSPKTEISAAESKTENAVIADSTEKTEEIPTDKTAEKVLNEETETSEADIKSNEEKKAEKIAETFEKTETNSAEKSFDPSQLANVRLIISLKNGEKIEHPMSEVVWFNVNQGILTVITNGGKTEKFSILDVAKMTIE